MSLSCFVFFFCKQKTAYEMRISDWSSDVCSSDLFDDLAALGFVPGFFHERELAAGEGDVIKGADGGHEQHAGGVEFSRDTTQVVQDDAGFGADRKSTRLNSSN